MTDNNMSNDLGANHVAFLNKLKDLLHEVHAGHLSAYEVIDLIDEHISKNADTVPDVGEIVYHTRKIQNLLWEQKEQVVSKLKDAISIMGDTRLALAGYVSSEAAIHKLDNFLADYASEKDELFTERTEEGIDYKQLYTQLLSEKNSGEWRTDLNEEVEQLSKACSEWAETSQNNYQLAKRYQEALKSILAPQYGLQGIIEDYPDPESKEYLESALNYYKTLERRYANLARKALS